MKCPTCRHENKPTAKFCANCGSKLEQFCPQCGANVEPGDKFCSECAAPLESKAEKITRRTTSDFDALSFTPPYLAQRILKKRTLIEGERRTITVLYADAKGFTPISERLGEEAIYDLSKKFVDLMMDSVHRYEGTINQFRGDGILALFGAPIAHEDSARRAVAAALEMQTILKEYASRVKKQYGIDLQFRIGLNTGPVVVGKIHDNLEMDYTAYGDTMNLGARMEEMAEPGAVYLSENTYRVVADYFECESLGSQKVKGKENSVVVYRALRSKPVKTRFDAATVRGLSPYVGRQHEMTVLMEYMEQVNRGQGQVVLISSEAGSGKSRLLLEFHKAIQDREVHWLEGRCISFGQNISYLPFIDIIRDTFGLEDDDNKQRIIEKINDIVGEWDVTSRENVPYLKYLLQVDHGQTVIDQMDPMERRARIFDGIRTILVEESKSKPLVLVVEDLHWIDAQSELAVKAIVDVIASIPLLMILTYRPSYKQTIGERTYFSRLSLSKLLPDEGVELASGMLQVSNLPEDLKKLISRKGEGNPFYIEEVVSSLIESGVLYRSNGSYVLKRPVEQIRVPNTIQEIILSRIDRLEHQTREAIQLASVIGREFTFRLLDRIFDMEENLDERLEELKVLELIYQKGYFPELSYMFKHALTQDVAYSTLLSERRIILHNITGSAIEKLYEERLAEQYEVLAYHFYEGENWEKALAYLLKSAYKSFAALANQDALTYLDKAFLAYEQLISDAKEILIEIYMLRAEIFFTMTHLKEAVESYDYVRALGHTIQNRSVEGKAIAEIAICNVYMHNWAEAESQAKEALIIAEENNDDIIKVRAIFALGFLDSIRGELDPGLKKVIDVVNLSQKAKQLDYEVFGYAYQNFIYCWFGQFEKAHLLGQKGIKIAERYQKAAPLAQIQWTDALALAGLGYFNKSIAMMKDTVSLCERISALNTLSRLLNTLGWVYNELLDWNSADKFNNDGLEIALKLQDSEIIYNAKINMADSAFGVGEFDKAGNMLEDLYVKLPQQHEWMKWRYTQHLTHSLGRVLLAGDKYDRAMKMADECLALAESTESRKNIIKGRRLRGQVFHKQGEYMEAEKEFSKALEIAHQIGNPPQLWKTYVALGDLQHDLKKKDQALQAYHNAVMLIEKVAKRLHDESLKNTFLDSEHIKSIIKKAGK